MIKTKKKPPYTQDGNTTFNQRNKAGVYLIYKKDSGLVYVGHSKTDLYTTLYRHFQSWEDKKQVRISYANDFIFNTPKSEYGKKFSVRVIYCTPSQAVKLERALILKYRPKDNPDKLEQYQISFEDKEQIRKIDELPEAPF